MGMSVISTFRLSLFMGISLLLSACYPPNQQGQQPGKPAPSEVYTKPFVDLLEATDDLSILATEKGLPNTVQSWVDNLIVTTQPGSDMPEIGRLNEGEKATYLHQRTLLKKEAVLRGQRYKERYILIKMNNGVMGWVHEGGIRYVYPRFQKVLDQIVVASNPNQRTRGGDPLVSDQDQRLIVPGVKVGPITKKTSQEKLLEIYGGTQVGLGIVKTPTGNEDCTVVFPDEPSELRITWQDSDRTKIKAIYIDKRESTWFTKEGLGVGLPLGEVTKVNKGAISFYGLDWDYGGTIDSWKNGNLAKYKKGFYGVIATARPDQKVPSNLQGDKVLSSNDIGVGEMNLVLGRLVIYLD